MFIIAREFGIPVRELQSYHLDEVAEYIAFMQLDAKMQRKAAPPSSRPKRRRSRR